MSFVKISLLLVVMLSAQVLGNPLEQKIMSFVKISLLLVVMLSAQVLGNPLEQKIVNELTFVKDGIEVIERVTVLGAEIKFEVISVTGGATLVLDYGLEQLVFANPSQKEACLINTFDKELQEQIPFDKLTELATSKEKFAIPKATYQLGPSSYEKTDNPVRLSVLSAELCTGLPTLVGVKQENTQALAKANTTKKPAKPGVGFWEVVLIIVVIILL